jgi:carbonic anhydrase
MSGQSDIRVARRDFLKKAGGVAVGLALSRVGFAAEPGAPPPKPENVLSPDAALDRLLRGNTRYVEGVAMRHDFKTNGKRWPADRIHLPRS